MCSDWQTASQGCAFFSATGIIFMSWIGIMLIKQPFFILGIEDVETAKGNAFGAAAIFLFTFLLSIFYQLNETRQLNFADLQSLSSQPGRGSIGRFGEYSNIVLRDHSDSGQGHEDEDPFVTTTLQRSDSGVSLSRRRTNGNTPTGIIV